MREERGVELCERRVEDRIEVKEYIRPFPRSNESLNPFPSISPTHLQFALPPPP